MVAGERDACVGSSRVGAGRLDEVLPPPSWCWCWFPKPEGGEGGCAGAGRVLRAPKPPIENLLNKPNPSAAPDDDDDFADPFLAAFGVCKAAPALTTLVRGCIIRNGSFVGGEVASGLVTPLLALVGIGIPVPAAEVTAVVTEELPPPAVVVAGVANEMEPLRR